MNIHLFMDPYGHYCAKFAERVKRIDPNNNVIANINSAKTKFEGVIEFDGFSEDFKQWIFNQQKITRIYYHYYNPIFQVVNKELKNKNPQLISVWCFWGGDFFALPEFLEDKYLTFSKSCLKKPIINRSNFFRQTFTKLYHKLKGTIHYDHHAYIESFKQIDYFAAYFHEDFQIVKDYSKANFKFHQFPYLSLDLILGENLHNENYYNTDAIMVGHSADPSLNHYEVLELLKNKNCTSPVFLSLTYGNDFYKKQLLNAIKNFNLTIEIQQNIVPLEEYNNKIRSFGIAIFNVNHQQAFGNIISLLWFGVKLFLHHKSAIYKDFKLLGFHIYTIEELNENNALTQLNFEQKNRNRTLLQELLSAKMADEMNLQLLQLK